MDIVGDGAGKAAHHAHMRRQSGATAVEFALVFPILLGLIYCGLVYSYVFLLQQAVNFAVQQGVQAAVAVVPQGSSGNTTSLRLAQATLAANSTLSWLPASQLARFQASSPTSCGGGQALPSGGFAVQGTFALSGGTGGTLFPTLGSLPFIGSIPILPTQLVSCAVAVT